VGTHFGDVWVVFLDVGRVEESVGWGRDADGCVLRGMGVCGLYVEAEFMILVVIKLYVVGIGGKSFLLSGNTLLTGKISVRKFVFF
jgi:hypothetical protein